MKKKIAILLLIVCILISFTGVASAYSIGTDKWYSKSVQVNYNSLDPTWKTPTYNSMKTWNNVGANISLVNKTAIDHVTIGTSSAFPNNGILANESGTHGRYNSTTGKWEKVSSKILINNKYTWSTASTCPSGAYDVQSVITHELGHTLCIGHSSNTNAVMYEPTASGTIWKRVLSTDDKNALKAIYT